MDLDTVLEELSWIPRDESIDPVCLCGDVVKTRLMRFGSRKIFEAVLEESNAHALSQPLTCRWFNLHYIQKVIATGQRLIIFGRVKRKGLRLVVDHPECEVIEDDEEILIHFRRITPIYPATEGLSQRVLRGLIFRLLEQVDVASADVPLPDSLGNGDDEDALRKIHFPDSDEQLQEVRARLVLGEFFRMQMQIAVARAENSARIGCRHQTQGLLAEKFIAALPFGLTRAQQRVLSEIKHDGGDCNDVVCRRVRIAGRPHGADANFGRATLRGFAQLARSARDSHRAAHRRASGRQHAVAAVCACKFRFG